VIEAPGTVVAAGDTWVSVTVGVSEGVAVGVSVAVGTGVSFDGARVGDEVVVAV
jgi:hypothetical protein